MLTSSADPCNDSNRKNLGLCSKETGRHERTQISIVHSLSLACPAAAIIAAAAAPILGSLPPVMDDPCLFHKV